MDSADKAALKLSAVLFATIVGFFLIGPYLPVAVLFPLLLIISGAAVFSFFRGLWGLKGQTSKQKTEPPEEDPEKGPGWFV